MILWSRVVEILFSLKFAFRDKRTFYWFAVAVIGLSVRSDMAGVTSIVRSLGLVPMYYARLLGMFHSAALCPDKLAATWMKVVRQYFPDAYRVNNRVVLLGDGIKIPKEGKKMPAVKSLHQESDSNTKPEYIMGHSCQAISLLVGCGNRFFAVPLISRIHEGIVYSNRCKATLFDKMLLLLGVLEISDSYYLVADAYYATNKMVQGLIDAGNHLVTRVRSNAVAYEAVLPPSKKQRGRKKQYGKKVYLRNLFKDLSSFTTAELYLYGENVTVRYQVQDLLWRPVGIVVRFVAVSYPGKGKIILMSSDISLPATDIIKLYALRFKIECGFKQALHTIGTYSYHFWMKDMTPIKKHSGKQHLHKKSEQYRTYVRRKINAYHAFMQTGIITHGIFLYLAAYQSSSVWTYFGSWLRTIRPGVLPSEAVVSTSLRNSLPAFLADSGDNSIIAKFIREKIDISRSEGRRLVA